LSNPGYDPITKREAIGTNRLSRVRTASIAGVSEAYEFGGICAIKMELESSSAFEVVNDMLGSIPVNSAIVVHELA
jgi:hypothetical protein